MHQLLAVAREHEPRFYAALLFLLSTGVRRGELLGLKWEERNFERSWQRVPRRARKDGVRPPKLHCARHTYASRALAAGKSVRWVADQLGHANPELTLRTYAHVLPDREEDLAFADFVSVSDAPGRPQTAPQSDAAPEDESALDASARERSRNLERETGVEPATLSLG
ncbi:MAG TPA: site-specific integrase, partial [Myxococcota bacterium]|nr:site-specific integrase [Myxococcota bacterium]